MIRDLEVKVEKLERANAQAAKELASCQLAHDHLKSKCSNLQTRVENAFEYGLRGIAEAFARGLKG